MEAMIIARSFFVFIENSVALKILTPSVKAQHSDSLILVWRVAEFEARNLNYSSIEPAHLLLGLCKIVDLDLPELVSKDTPNRNDILEEVLREVRRLRTVFRTAGLDAKSFRRRLRRASAERRFSMIESGRLRRSSAAKRVFAEAEHLAHIGGGTVYPVHLLYASLVAKDEHRDTTLTELGIEKKRLMNAVNDETLTPQIGSVSASKKAKTRWN
jgi:ATP-dependent Clp protease ATP-binding subunit ClpC